MRALFVLGLLCTQPDEGLPLSPDLGSAASAAVAEVRARLFAAPAAAASGWRVEPENRARDLDAEATAAVLAALAAEGVSAEVGPGAIGSGVALSVRGVGLEGREGILVRISGPASATVLAPFVRKPWVRSPPPAPPGGLACRGESEPEASESTAVAGALADGAAKLRGVLARCGIARSALDRLLPDGEADRRLRADLFVRRAGEGWVASALFQAGPEEIQALARAAGNLERQRRLALARRLLGLLGIGAASFLFYLWVDFATAGRATRGARLLALAFATGGAAFLAAT